MARTALELMGQAGLGYSFDPLERDSTDPYGYALKNLTCVHPPLVLLPTVEKVTLNSPALQSLMMYRNFAVVARTLFPTWMNRAIVDMFPKGTDLHSLKETVDTMSSRSRELYNAKKLALEKGDAEVTKQVAEGKDVMSIFSMSRPPCYMMQSTGLRIRQCVPMPLWTRRTVSQKMKSLSKCRKCIMLILVLYVSS